MCLMTGGMQMSLPSLKGAGLREGQPGQPYLSSWEGERELIQETNSSHMKDKLISSAEYGSSRGN